MLTMIHKMIHKRNGILTDRLFQRKWLFYFINWQLRMPCYIINGVNIKICSQCPCLAPRFVPVSKTGMNRDRTEVLPWQTGINRGAFVVVLICLIQPAEPGEMSKTE